GASLHPPRLRAQVPHPRRGRSAGRGDRAVPGPRRASARAERRRGGATQCRRRRSADRTGGTVLMLHSKLTASAKRRLFREGLASGELMRVPGAFNPLSAKPIEDKGFEGVYISGAVLSADLGLPDIGLTTLTEVAQRGGQIARVTELPTLIDADTGFGEPMNVARTVQLLEDAGVSGM